MCRYFECSGKLAAFFVFAAVERPISARRYPPETKYREINTCKGFNIVDSSRWVDDHVVIESRKETRRIPLRVRDTADPPFRINYLACLVGPGAWDSSDADIGF